MKKLPIKTVECLKQQVATNALADYCAHSGYTIKEGYEKAQPMHVRIRMTASLMRSSINCYAVIAESKDKEYIVIFDMYEGLIDQFDFSGFDKSTTEQLSPEEELERKKRNEYGPLFTEFSIADVPVVRKYDADGWIYHAPATSKKKK